MDHYKITISKTEYTVDRIKDKDAMDEAALMFLKAMEQGDGLSKNEFASKDVIIRMLTNWSSYLIRRKSDMLLAAVFAIRKSPLVRSEKSIYHAQYMITNPEHRGMSLGSYVTTNLLSVIAADCGYVASVSRAAMVSKVIKPAIRAKFSFIGTIPNSMYFPQYGWVEDVVCYSSSDPDGEKSLPVNEEDVRIPPMKYDESYVSFLNQELPCEIEFPPLLWGGKKLAVVTPSPIETFQVEEMIRDAAREGKGFALDEFNSHGYMNRGLFQKSHMAVVKSLDGEIKAGIIFGTTLICREVKTTQACGHIVVKKNYREKGLGNAILDYCLNNMERLRYTAILTDVLVTDLRMLGMMYKRGFIASATIPNSGVVNGYGRTNTLLMYKAKTNIKLQKAKL